MFLVLLQEHKPICHLSGKQPACGAAKKRFIYCSFFRCEK
ncbi:hypothetical protein CHCC14821_2566 [Bacillus paralicheniformis]|nr:hypothetical protein CHCC14821_2566 [Bacillus paralicheniformis]